ncbi:MAG: pantoate--beta-alanine ligase [Candidatus Lambdaproteobacteria bacterium RIFOXYD2_FULL_50_16]|uniref:Pantothenate synthetase n=1 Tax=Candidatus Lambdaproteobacteria bacterium RIFOXYD2_FULL_50_16 TaxID=1817772 RepID=A0A1F6GFN0_9PROT|nr:MAG: pantoate--beta-alanine ligase [Candidatus Lambdaproteobacteria bacterium RIFOXYD2_FULL_50_16]
MEVTKKIVGLREWLAQNRGASLGLVPTMGFLHQGHLALVKAAKAQNERVAVSIFVNPLQFNSPEDFENYPINIEEDLRLLAEAGVDLVFTPPPEEIYPKGFDAQLRIGAITKPLEGSARPGHFDGVTTVVAKFFNLFTPDRAYFGEKDAQQLLVIKKMAQDMNYGVQVIGCPTVREPGGLALSSRNSRLKESQKEEALLIWQALQLGKQKIAEGLSNSAQLIELMSEVVLSGASAAVDYISINDTQTLEPVEEITGEVLISLAVFLGKVRLIDNITVPPKA